jgi:hypothetical protein
MVELLSLGGSWVLCADATYFRAKPPGAQFKEMQNRKPEFLQNFCFYRGWRRDNMRKQQGIVIV